MIKCARPLSGNMLKIIGALLMLTDHIGLIFFPGVTVLRIIGRLAFPIFAFFIAEGCRYTKNRLRYFLTVSGLAFVCQLGYWLFTRATNMSIFVTFSLSILCVYAVQHFKEVAFDEERTRVGIFVAFLLVILALALPVILEHVLRLKFDYGAVGALVPVLTSLFHKPRNINTAHALFDRLDTHWMSVLLTAVGLIILALNNDVRIQLFSLFALPLLLMYSGERGRWKLKYFFYVFYPAHLALLYGIAMLIN